MARRVKKVKRALRVWAQPPKSKAKQAPKLAIEPVASLPEGRGRYPIVPQLRGYLRAYGYTDEGVANRRAFAHRVGTVVAYLMQLAGGYRKASLEVALAIERESFGCVPARALVPDADWDYIDRVRQKKPGAAPHAKAKARSDDAVSA